MHMHAQLFGQTALAGLALATLAPTAVQAQAASPGSAQRQEATAPAAEDIVVTGSRIERAGFDAPTPTTVVGQIELQLGNRPSVAQVLNDLPQFRATQTPTSTSANTNNSTSSADLRGLGPLRTLTLLNGRRFVGSSDLNTVPLSVVERVEVVTGGASAAWGSGAVAGVVNIILNDDLEGFRFGADAGISSRNDAARSRLQASYGRRFAGDRGHMMVAAEYLQERGAFDRDKGPRPSLDGGLFVQTDGKIILAQDINFLNATQGGVITSGALAGQAFNRDGTLSPVSRGSVSNAANTIGGTSRSQLDSVAVTSPYERYNLFGRVSYELGEAAKVWADAAFTRIESDFGFFPEVVRGGATSGGIVLSRDNPYLSPAVRARLASGPATFRMGRFFGDTPGQGELSYQYRRDTLDLGVGIEGSFGAGWKYNASYGHGEIRNRDAIDGQRIGANFNRAIDAVVGPGGQIVCRVALTDPTTACRPLNLFGVGNIDPEAVSYSYGAARSSTVTKLDTVQAALRGDPFSTWAGPVSIAVGAEARWESLRTTADPLSASGSFTLVNFTPLKGQFDVKEGFGEVLVPLLNAEGTAVLEANGAARYSDYSNSGGIWTWKVGGTLRLFDDLLLRAVLSRDIRSPSIAELFTARITNIQNVSDPFNAGQVVSVIRFGGGNPDLEPETAKTLTLGGSYSPRFAPGLRLSVDWYNIRIDQVIGGLTAQDIVNQCFAGNQALCDATVRDPDGTLTTVFATFLNLARYETTGVDFEASYVTQAIGGTLSLRGLATYVQKLEINDGVNTFDRAGDVGDVAFSTPKWRATASANWRGDVFGADVRVRYVGGGDYNSLLNIENSRIGSRTYLDLGGQINVGSDFQLFGTVNNLFDRQSPITSYNNPLYDMIGRTYSLGVKGRF